VGDGNWREGILTENKALGNNEKANDLDVLQRYGTAYPEGDKVEKLSMEEQNGGPTWLVVEWENAW
jgi:hypothetical protein